MTTTHFRPVTAEIDLGAVRANVAELKQAAGPAELMAVVKADAYGHGAVEVARAAADAGAAWLGVALVEEGVELRQAGIEAPILVLSEPPLVAADTVVAADLTPVVYRERWADALAKALVASGAGGPLSVHVKVDTGMHRAGCDVDDLVALARVVRSHDELRLGGVMTHFAVADEPEHPANDAQQESFESAVAQLREAGFDPGLVHAANSAALLTRPTTRYDLVRCGIALYGIPPAPSLDGAISLAPVMSLRAEVSHVRRVQRGEAISYGLRYPLAKESTIATVPIGYGDGVPRRLGHVGGHVLIGGRRRPIAGTITMDQLMADCADDDVRVGAEVVLIGTQPGPDGEPGDEQEITATEWAELVDTIGYEITCGVGARVPRRFVS